MKKNLLYLNYVLSRKLTSATRNILRLVPATSIIVFSVGYDSNHMMLNGKFSYKKENQRTLSFNVDIVKLPEHKTVFAGSSSKLGKFYLISSTHLILFLLKIVPSFRFHLFKACTPDFRLPEAAFNPLSAVLAMRLVWLSGS